jgi:hypothetical protein
VVKVAPVLDPLGRFPYAATSYDKRPGSLWGKALPEDMEDIQRAFDANVRAMVNQGALASGPMMAYDKYSAAPLDRIAPWLVLQYDSSKSQGKVPYTWFTMEFDAESFLAVNEMWRQEADDRTQIPRYTYGNPQLAGAGDTASGLSMLLGTTAKGLRRILGFYDSDIQCEVLSRVIAFNQMYSTNPALRGDAQVVPKGALQLLARDTQEAKRSRFLGLAAQPLFQPFFKPEGIAYLLRSEARANDMPEDKIIRTDEEIGQRMQAMQAAAQAPPGAGPETGQPGKGVPPNGAGQ